MLESVVDVLLITYLGLGIVLTIIFLVLVLLLQRNLLRMIRSLRNAAGNIEDITESVVSKIAKPLSSGSSIGIGASGILGFLSTMGRLFGNRDKKNGE